ncbi:uncharacterized protein LOC116108655 [Pistacia vera]|uniref:uncharacterized protein LOC116108655 n=1 Tax=Pistacia vera TaxID=55513 RepID=UPI00126367A4|nr:uncharacterized protein LOC116108655 [Pistacia vera]
MSSSGSCQQSASMDVSQTFRGRNDIAWAHVNKGVDENRKKILTCLYCGKIIRGGGIYRVKLHLAGVKGEVGKCPKVPFDVKFKIGEALNEIGVKNKQKVEFRKNANTYGASVQQFEDDMVDEDQECEEVSPCLAPAPTPAPTSTVSNKRKKSIGIGDYFASRTKAGCQSLIKSVLAGKEAKWRVDMAVARLFYDSCILTNVINSIYFQPMADATAAIGPEYKIPTYHNLRVNLLRDAKKEVQLLVDSYKKTWENVECTLMADGWTNNSHRLLINFLVYCPKGVCFVKSVDASDVVKDAATLFGLFEEIALWVGPNNIVYLVTDNGANYKAAGRMLFEKYSSITWSPCAVHCINLMLKDIAEMSHIVNLSTCASKVTKFVYNHSFVLALLRKKQHKHDLQSTVTDRTFVECRYAKTNKGKAFISIVLDNQFWDDIGIVSKVVSPLMRMLRIVDSNERPSIGYVYDSMYRTRTRIKKLFKNKKNLYKPYTTIIKMRWDRMLRHDIHVATYYLNPAFKYDKDTFSKKPEIMYGFLDTSDNKASAFKISKTTLLEESRLYRDRLKSYSRELALQTCKTTRPDEWWRTFGFSTPNLQKEGAIPIDGGESGDHPSYYDSTDASEDDVADVNNDDDHPSGGV